MPPHIILTGPTSCGKARVAHVLARRTGGEVILMDSMKIYRGMDIGTAKPSMSLRSEVPYHLVDVVDPVEEFSVGEYLRRALEAVEQIEARSRQVIFCGGTALYLSALLEGLFVGPPADWILRQSLKEEIERAGLASLHRRLRREDPRAADRIHPNDERRIVRALEVHAKTGLRITDSWKGDTLRLDDGSYRLFGIRWERQELYRRIDRRVVRMAEEGFFEEVRRLGDQPGGLGRAASQCIGYKEILEADRTGTCREDVIDALQQRTRKFAKQQHTWFRRLPIHWVQLAEPANPEEVAKLILAALDEEFPGRFSG